ncbi:LptF/LptG family permease [Amphibiibacter pelophylacis]|uniref:LptF/LptG family permease n=1 Tax=Amphibiibacter pelophylacis TaxID=1799477 RepID=A0ACC6P494_9BURK
MMPRHRRLILGLLLQRVLLLVVALLALFAFLDATRVFAQVRPDGYSWLQALGQIGLRMPRHLYDGLPLAVLLGAVMALSHLAQTSQFTVLRAAGLAPRDLVRLLAGTGVALAALTWLWGDQVATRTDQAAQTQQDLRLGRRAATDAPPVWLRERWPAPGSPSSEPATLRFISARVRGSGELADVVIQAFDDQGRLRSTWRAAGAQIPPTASGHWTLMDARRTDFPPAGDAPTAPPLAEIRQARMDWPTQLDTALVLSALSPSYQMSSARLLEYGRHLRDAGQSDQPYSVALWNRIFYALGCGVLLLLALPFAYAPPRRNASGMALLAGTLLGVAYVLANSVAAQIGQIYQWNALASTAWPTLLALAGATLWLRRTWRLR